MTAECRLNITSLGALDEIREYDRIILGIDPGTIVMGYGLIGIRKKQAFIISLGVVKLGQTDDHMFKLKKIFERTLSIIDQYAPDELAIEAPFFGKNVQSMLKLGRAQGIAISAALSRQLHVHEYSPKKIKQSITGNGNASKEQVAGMLGRLLRFEETPEFLDATDGLGAAYCHFLQNNQTVTQGATYGSWKAFVTANKGKVKKG
jgi:crossover junction endodeoxyribonuclease RuvC